MELSGPRASSAENLGDQSDLIDGDIFSQSEGLEDTLLCLGSQGFGEEALFVVAVDQITQLFAGEGMEDGQDPRENGLI